MYLQNHKEDGICTSHHPRRCLGTCSVADLSQTSCGKFFLSARPRQCLFSLEFASQLSEHSIAVPAGPSHHRTLPHRLVAIGCTNGHAATERRKSETLLMHHTIPHQEPEGTDLPPPARTASGAFLNTNWLRISSRPQRLYSIARAFTLQ